MGDKSTVAGVGCLAIGILLLNIAFWTAILGGAVWVVVFVLQQMNVI